MCCFHSGYINVVIATATESLLVESETLRSFQSTGQFTQTADVRYHFGLQALLFDGKRKQIII